MKDGRGGKWANAALQKGYANHDDCMPHDQYVKWQRDCLMEMMRIIPEDGAIFYNHKWRVQGGLLQDRQDIVGGFPVRQIIIWKRKGGLNFNAGYFLPTYEVIYLIAKPKFKLAEKANSHGDVWEFTQEMNNRSSCAFPIKLIDRIISSTSAKIILDPFMGSGTTAISAINFNREYIGIDISPEYCEMAEKRIKQHQDKQSKLFNAMAKKPIIYTKILLIENSKKFLRWDGFKMHAKEIVVELVIHLKICLVLKKIICQFQMRRNGN